MLNRARSDITKNSIRNYFRHAGLSLEDEAATPADVNNNNDIVGLWQELGRQLDMMADRVELDDFLAIDDDVAVTAALSDTDIAADMTAAAAVDDCKKAEDPEDEEPPCPTLHEAFSVVDMLYHYCSGI
ncbi:hypothetical protein IscW_ISCW022302 [Ixodes scapularis]|uniref:Uncharacterized protein n=1 Tax=Ixodes scapularis TaxID=6945 RepID=B7QB17_IXOSC|nr:hypothetical protein IscW_ISCW022302 [Ixodes scapularis]|eukprot:XP_002412743.1 hypothetical protein IscW_ISCW022302 [Ixodes scapularis]